MTRRPHVYGGGLGIIRRQRAFGSDGFGGTSQVSSEHEFWRGDVSCEFSFGIESSPLAAAREFIYCVSSCTGSTPCEIVTTVINTDS